MILYRQGLLTSNLNHSNHYITSLISWICPASLEALSLNSCPRVRYFKRPKLKTLQFGVRKGLLIGKGTNQEDGRLSNASNPFFSLDKINGFYRVKGNRYVEVLLEQVLITGSWNLAIYGKGHQHHIFLDNWPFASEKALVLQFQLCSGPWVTQRRVHDFGFGCNWRSNFSPLHVL